MTIIYCPKDKREKAVKSSGVQPPFGFANLSDKEIDHSATKVIVMGDHPEIVKRYAGLAEIKVLSEPKDKKDNK